MQAAALHPVLLSELEKATHSAAYSNGAAIALCAYASALKNLALGHMQDEKTGANATRNHHFAGDEGGRKAMQGFVDAKFGALIAVDKAEICRSSDKA